MNNITQTNLIGELLSKAIKETDFPTKVVKDLDRLVFQYFEEDDADEVLRLLYYLPKFYEVLDYLTRDVIDCIEEPHLKEMAFKLLEQTRQEPDHLILSDDDCLILLAECGQDASQRYEIEMLKYHMGVIAQADESIRIIVTESPMRLYFDYIFVEMDKFGSDIEKKRKFLLDGLAKLEEQNNIIKLLAERDRTLDQAPNLKKSVIDLTLIPPGVIKGLPVGIKMTMLITILSRASIVAEFFLKKI